MPEDIRTKELASYIRAGAFFPDAFYSCMGHSDLAEDTHWPPFLKTAVDYWVEKYHIDETELTNTTLLSSSSSSSHDKSSIGTKVKLGLFQRVLNVLNFNDISTKNGQTMKTVDPNGLALKAFIFGILTHQVADVSWHSLGVQQGLLRMLANREFDGDVSEAHNILDTGGDMIYVRRLLQSGRDFDWIQADWKYPTEDILEIIARAGYKSVSTSQLDYCMFRGKAAIGAEIQISSTAFVPYAQRSPLLFDNLNNYYLGGVAEMTLSSRHCSYSLAEWFDSYKTPKDPWSVCEIYEGMKGKSNIHHRNNNFVYMDNSIPSSPPPSFNHYTETTAAQAIHKDKNNFKNSQLIISNEYNNIFNDNNYELSSSNLATIISTGMPHAAFGSSLAIGYFLNGQPCIAMSAPFESITYETERSTQEIPKGSVYIIELSQLQEHLQQQKQQQQLTGRPSILKPSQMIALDEPYSPSTYQFNERFGANLVKINLLGLDVLVVSRPGTSRLSFYLENKNIFDIYWGSARTKYGSSGLKLVGESLAVGDLDGDGIEDLIVGSPYSDVEGHIQAGEVDIINGFALEAIFSVARERKTSPIPLEFEINDVVATVLHIPSLSKSSPGYSLFGSKVAVVSRGSMTTYLLVGAEGVGKVYAFDAKRGFKNAFVLSSNVNSYSGGNFGGRLLTGNDEGWIAIGSTTEDVYSDRTGRLKCSQCGAVYLYRIRDDFSDLKINEISDNSDELSAEEKSYLTFKTRKAMMSGSFSRFGHEGTIVDSTLYTSSPYGLNDKGQIWKLDLSEYNHSDFVPIIEQGPRPYSNGFGSSIVGIKNRTNNQVFLASGMPYFGINDDNWLQGAVAIYNVEQA